MRAGRRQRAERGSLALEYVIVAPLFLIVFALIFSYARVSQLDGTLDAGTRDAARAVSQAPDLGAAHAVALNAVKSALGRGGNGGCNAGNVSVSVEGYPPGSNAPTPDLQPGYTVTVTSTCHYSLSDLGLPLPIPELTATSQFSSVIDPNRSVA